MGENYRLLVHSLLYKMKGRNQKDFMTTLRDLMHPKKRLHSLMMCHSLGSFFVGIIGFLFPATFGWFFLDAKMDSFGTEAAVITRLYCALVFAQGWIIMNLTDSTRHVKKSSHSKLFRLFSCFFRCINVCTFVQRWHNAGGF